MDHGADGAKPANSTLKSFRMLQSRGEKPVNELEWLESEDGGAMLDFLLTQRGRERELRLFACSWYSWFRDFLLNKEPEAAFNGPYLPEDTRNRDAVKTVERFERGGDTQIFLEKATLNVRLSIVFRAWSPCGHYFG